jgi:hypothetical protein
MTEELRRQLLVVNDRGWFDHRIVARIIGATSSEMWRFLKGEPALTLRHLQALQAWRDNFVRECSWAADAIGRNRGGDHVA